MKLVVPNDVLAECLAIVGGAITKKSSVPIMAGVRILVDGKIVTVDAFNFSGEKRRIAFQADTATEDGACVVNHEQLSAIVGKLRTRITLETKGKNKLAITGGEYSGTLSTFDADDWYATSTESEDENGGFTLAMTDPHILATVSQAASVDESRPTLTNVMLRVESPTPPIVDNFTLAATDGYRLTLYQQGTLNTGKVVEMLLPRTVAVSIAKISSSLNASASLMVNKDFTRGTVKFFDTVSPIQWAELKFSLSTDRFPAFETIIPSDGSATITMLCIPAGLISAIDRALTMSDDIARVKLTLSPHEIKVERETLSGVSSERVPLLSGDEKEFDATADVSLVMVASGKYLMNGLSIFNKPVTIRATQPTRPLKLSEGNWTHVVMPMVG